MTKVKLRSWNPTAKEVKLKSGSKVQILKATSSLFDRILVIAGADTGNWLGGTLGRGIPLPS